jgi:hypothetical protein
MSELITKLPEDIKVVALQRQREETSEAWEKSTDELCWAFNWFNTPEDFDIWGAVCKGNYAPFREFHAKLKNASTQKCGSLTGSNPVLPTRPHG